MSRLNYTKQLNTYITHRSKNDNVEFHLTIKVLEGDKKPYTHTHTHIYIYIYIYILKLDYNKLNSYIKTNYYVIVIFSTNRQNSTQTAILF